MIPPEKRSVLCYCPCCCLSDSPADSCEHPLEYAPTDLYNPRTDCSCKRRWPHALDYDLDVRQFAMVLAMRARDCGEERIARQAEEALGSLYACAIDLA